MCYDRKSSSAFSAKMSSTDVELTSGDFTSDHNGDVDDVIFVEGPRGDHVEGPASVEVYSSLPDVTVLSRSGLLQVLSSTTAAVHESSTAGPRVGQKTSPETTSTSHSGDSAVPLSALDQEGRESASRYLALVINVALLTGIVFVVAVFLAVAVSFVLYRRRQCHQNVTSTASCGAAPSVSRLRIKPACDRHKYTSICRPTDKPRLFVSASSAADPKEWFV